MAEDNVTLLPAQILVEDLAKFTQDIDCLHVTLPLFMTIMSIMHEQTHKEYLDFIEKNSTDRAEEGSELTYTVKVADIAEHSRLKRKYDTSRSAMKLIPRQFITSLVSQYDSFLGRVIHYIFAVRPDILNASEKAIQFTELIQFPSIEAAYLYCRKRSRNCYSEKPC